MPVRTPASSRSTRPFASASAIFDVSHMGEFDVKGRGATAYLQRLTPNDVGKLADGHAHYSAFLRTGEGHVRRRPARLSPRRRRLHARRQRWQHAQGLRLGLLPGRSGTCPWPKDRRHRAPLGSGAQGGGAPGPHRGGAGDGPEVLHVQEDSRLRRTHYRFAHGLHRRGWIRDLSSSRRGREGDAAPARGGSGVRHPARAVSARATRCGSRPRWPSTETTSTRP